MSKRLQIILAAVVATVAGALSQIANTPPELQTQLPQMFPEHYRGLIGLGLKIVMGADTGYASWAALHRGEAALIQQPPEPAITAVKSPSYIDK